MLHGVNGKTRRRRQLIDEAFQAADFCRCITRDLKKALDIKIVNRDKRLIDERLTIKGSSDANDLVRLINRLIGWSRFASE